MHLLRTLPALVIVAGQLMPCLALSQQQKTPVNVNANSLFGDLPIDDAAGNSILHAGESGQEKIRKNLFVLGALNKSVCYSGEPILLTYQLYSALQSRSEVAERPSLVNFNAEERRLNNEDPLRKKRDGKDYRVFTIWQAQLNPFQPGHLTIDPLSVNNVVSYTLDGKPMTYSGVVRSNAIEITVLPLPEYKGAETFSGGVGKFKFRVSVASARVAAGETDSLRIELEGAGNLNAVTIPSIKWPTGFESFPGKEKWEMVKNVFPPRGKKVVTMPFVVHGGTHEHPLGRVVFPSLRFVYFDPSPASYRESISQPIALDIQPALPGSQRAPVPIGPTPVTAQPVADIPFDYAWILWALSSLGISIVAFLALKKRAQPYLEPIPEVTADHSDTPPPVPMSAADIVAGELESLTSVPDKEQYVIGIKSALDRYLWEKFKTGGISGDELADTVYHGTHDQVLSEQVRGLYSRCSELLYAPSAPGEKDSNLGGAVNSIVERCEIHKNINRQS